MILGEHPCCGAPLGLPLMDGPLPAFQKHACPKCGATLWTRHSRIDPETYTEDEFKKRFTVDEETHSVTENIDEDEREFRQIVAEAAAGAARDVWGEEV